MKFTFSVSPNLRQKQSTSSMMRDISIALMVVFGFACFYYFKEYGVEEMLQAILLLITAVVSAFACEAIFAFFIKKEHAYTFQYVKSYISSNYGIVSALILTLMCPLNIKPYALCVATLFAILFGKLLFGGFGNNIFNPAAVGRAIIFATFMGATTDVITSVTPTTLIAGDYNWLVVNPEMISNMMSDIGGLGQMFTGFYAGAIGETSTVLLLIIGVVLMIRRVVDWRTPIFYLLGILFLTAGIAIFRGVPSFESLPGFIWYPLLHLFSGGVVFGAVFMLSDPVTTPTSHAGKILFALGASIITVLIRMKANLPEGCLYAILIMNMCTPMIEKLFTGKILQLKKRAIISFASVGIIGIGSVLIAANAVEAKEPAPKVFISVEDKEVNKLDARVNSVVNNPDGSSTYQIAAQGYAAMEDPSKYNIFEIVVKDEKVVSFKVSEFVDTPYRGDVILSEEFIDLFLNKDLKDNIKIEKIDVVSEATFSTRSSVRALEEVRKALGY